MEGSGFLLCRMAEEAGGGTIPSSGLKKPIGAISMKIETMQITDLIPADYNPRVSSAGGS